MHPPNTGSIVTWMKQESGTSPVGDGHMIYARSRRINPSSAIRHQETNVIHLWATVQGIVGRHLEQTRLLGGLDWDGIFSSEDPVGLVQQSFNSAAAAPVAAPPADGAAPPIGSQEVWAAGVTYYRSRDARMAEAAQAGGADFYARVYDAERPELFMKATARRVVGSGGAVRVRSDANWTVPEPELVVAVNREGKIFGYTVGNDVSSRDIEGENPLYLPQAKIYDRSCALGPALCVSAEMPPASTRISMRVMRGGEVAVEGATDLTRLKRKPQDLVSFLFRDNSFPQGCYLMTGTGIVPAGDFTLAAGDRIEIEIERIGTLHNHVM